MEWIACLKWMNACVNVCVSWIEMEGWSEYRFRIDILKSGHGWYALLCENVMTGDIFTEMSPLVIFLLWIVWIACWSEWMHRVDGFVSWIEMEGWSEYRFRIDYCKAQKAEMPSVWKCHDWWHFYWYVTTWWYFYCGWMNSMLKMNGFMCGWVVSAGLRCRDDLSIGFVLIFAKQERLKCLQRGNVTTGGHLYWNVSTCDISNRGLNGEHAEVNWCRCEWMCQLD